MRGTKTLVSIALLLTLGCAHTEEEKMMRGYQSQVKDRIGAMDKNIARLETREQQLLGQPKAELTQAVDNLKRQTTAAKAESHELGGRDVATWTDKKPAVDASLANMDRAYDQALQVLAAH